MPTIETIKDSLTDLGETPREIADYLAYKDFQGHRYAVSIHPLADYLIWVFDEVEDVYISDETIVMYGRNGCMFPTIWLRNQFEQIRAFIALFDRGRYPELDIEENPDFKWE